MVVRGVSSSGWWRVSCAKKIGKKNNGPTLLLLFVFHFIYIHIYMFLSSSDFGMMV